MNLQELPTEKRRLIFWAVFVGSCILLLAGFFVATKSRISRIMPETLNPLPHMFQIKSPKSGMQ